MAEIDDSLIPELGDFVSFVSIVYKTISGIIIYRDGALIRIRPINSTAICVDFPLDPTTGLFQESLGVSQIVIHEKRKDPHFSVQLGVLRGELLEFVSADGSVLETVGVEEILATEEADAVRLTDGRVIDFGFIGPAPPIVRINARAPPDIALAPENDAAIGLVEEEPVELFPEIDETMLPASLVEEIPSEERVYSDSLQREDMFISLLVDHPISRQKDPKVMSRLYRTTDILLALKNSVLKRDVQGAPTGETMKYTVNTIQDVVERNNTPLGAVLPVAAVKKVLYADVDETADYEDVVVRNDMKSLLDSLSAANTFNIDSEQGNSFITYIHSLMDATAAFQEKEAKTKTVTIDQDVLRTRAPPAAVQGFPTTGAAFDKKKEPIALGLLALGDIDKRTARLLGPSTIKNTKTNTTYIVASGDTATVENYLLLPNDLALRRAPIRSGVLLWDVQRSEVGRSAGKSFYKALSTSEYRPIEVGDTDPLLEELQSRIQTSVQFANRALLTTIDNFGLTNLELTDALFAPIATSIVEGQKVWNTAYIELGKAAVARLSAPSIPVVGAVSDAVFNDTIMKHADLAEILSAIQGKESSLKSSDLLLTNAVLSAAYGTLYPFVYGVAAGIQSDGLKQTWKDESSRTQRIIENTRDAAKLLQATPDINKCVHVQELEKIRSIRDDSKRMILFEKFMKKYSAGQEGNNILCSNCSKTLVCKHEVMLLQEFLNPGRSAALHKSLLLEFAGPVFEGAYICKNCGQKIRDLEYDTHLEFDDEGRPLMGRSIIEPTEDDSGVAISSEAEADIPFTGSERGMYFTVRTLFELCGLAVDFDVYKRVVKTLSKYYNAYVQPETTYKANQDLLKAKATREGKRYVDIPYAKYAATELMKGCGALTVLELQTNPVNVPIAAPGCTLSRSGFPLEGTAAIPEAGVNIKSLSTGCIDYVACALASILRLNEPWTQLMWSTETDMKRRTEYSRMAIFQGLSKILCIRFTNAPAPVPLDEATILYNKLLDDARSRAAASTGVTDAALLSTSDKLPSAFRPAARMILEESSAPIKNVRQYQAAVDAGTSEVFEATQIRFTDLLRTTIAQYHTKAAESGVVQPNNPCSESVCCIRRLDAYGTDGNGLRTIGLADNIVEELSIVVKAAATLRRRDSSRPNAGTHYYVPWNAPLVSSVLPTPDASTYYKLFMKNCYAGRAYGTPHEYSEAYECRNCGFHMPEELVYLIPALISEPNAKKYEKAIEEQTKERERLALEAFTAQGVIINEDSFRAMEDKMKEKRLIAPTVPIAIRKFMDILNTHIPALLTSCDISIREDYGLLVVAIQTIVGSSLTGMSRLGPLRNFATRYQTLSNGLRDRLNTLVGGGEDILANIDRITEKGTFHNIVSACNNLFVVGASQVANGYTLKTIPVNKWFFKVNDNHKQTLLKIWETFGSVSKNSQMLLDDMSEDAIPVARFALKRFSACLGPLLKVFLSDLRPTIGFTPDEYTLFLRWTIKSSLYALVNILSVWYGDSPSSPIAAQACSFIAGWIKSICNTGGGYTRKYMMSDDEIRSKVAARTEREKNMFIAKMDRQEQEMRKLELVKKKLKIGDWAVGSKNLFKYNSDMYEFERAQRAAMGVPEFTDDITGATDAAGADLTLFAATEPGMEEGALHRAAQDEDETMDLGNAGRIHFVC